MTVPDDTMDVERTEPDETADFALDDDEPGLSWEEYLDKRREFDGRLLALVARLVTSQRFPRWVYHATKAPRVVASRAERLALGPGWHVTPV